MQGRDDQHEHQDQRPGHADEARQGEEVGRVGQQFDGRPAQRFTVARFPQRAEARAQDASARDVDAWVAAFKDKVAQIADRSCVVMRPAS